MLPAAFPLGPFLVEESGKLTFRSPHREAAFTFSWRGRRFYAAVQPGLIRLKGVIATVPSSAAGAHRRAPALDCLRALPGLLPPGWRLRLTPDHRIHLDTAHDLGWPANAADLLLPLLRFLLRLGPYLDLVEASGLECGTF